jgi:hypothetical protein
MHQMCAQRTVKNTHAGPQSSLWLLSSTLTPGSLASRGTQPYQIT